MSDVDRTIRDLERRIAKLEKQHEPPGCIGCIGWVILFVAIAFAISFCMTHAKLAERHLDYHDEQAGKPTIGDEWRQSWDKTRKRWFP